LAYSDGIDRRWKRPVLIKVKSAYSTTLHAKFAFWTARTTLMLFLF
jgi:hypothetical protein